MNLVEAMYRKIQELPDSPDQVTPITSMSKEDGASILHTLRTTHFPTPPPTPLRTMTSDDGARAASILQGQYPQQQQPQTTQKTSILSKLFSR